MSELQMACPTKKCRGTLNAIVSNDEGNAQARCDDCHTEFGFHYTIEIDGIYEVDE